MNMRRVRVSGIVRRMSLICVMVHMASLACATTYYVSLDGNDAWDGTNWVTAVATISNALAKASSGDIVLVANGTYVLSAAVPRIDYGITVRGLSRDETIVDGGNAVQCFSYVYGTIDNLSITRGKYSFGAAVASYNGAKLLNLNVYSNYSANGFTIYSLRSFLISNCFIHGNTVGVEGGGGIGAAQLENSRILNCVISNNVSSNKSGAAINISSTDAQSGLIQDCTIVDNVSTGGSSSECGGINCAYNAAHFYNVAIRRCVIARNIGGKRPSGYAAYGGGGLNLGSNTGLVENCLIYGNTADRGGGVAVRSTNTLFNCTIVSNVAADNYGGIYDVGEARVINSIVYYNEPNMQGGVDLFNYCCLTTTNGIGGEGNITNAPDFVAIETSDCRLKPNSPCANAGANQPGMDAEIDLAGNPRLDRFARRVDMGAYERVPSGILVLGR